MRFRIAQSKNKRNADPLFFFISTFPRTKEVSVRGFYVWVTFDDVPIPVYGEETDGAAKSAYIAVEEGQNFKVHWVDERTTAPKDSYDVCLAIDGELYVLPNLLNPYLC